MVSLKLLAAATLGLVAAVHSQDYPGEYKCTLPGLDSGDGEAKTEDWARLASTWCQIWQGTDRYDILPKMGYVDAERQLSEDGVLMRLSIGWPEECTDDDAEGYDAYYPVDGITCTDIMVILWDVCKYSPFLSALMRNSKQESRLMLSTR